MDTAAWIAVAGLIATVVGTLGAALGAVALQAKLGRQHERESRLWSERLAVYAEAAVAVERVRVHAYNLTQPHYQGSGGPTRLVDVPELTPSGVLTARIEALAPATVRAAWGALVEAELDLKIEVDRFAENDWDPGAYETPGWPENTRELVAVRAAVERFREAVRAAVGNQD